MTHGLPGGLALSWLWAEGASPSCPSISPVWNLSYTKKYLELKIKNVIWERLIGTVKESDLLPIYLTCISHCQFSYGKNPPHLDNRYKANRFVRSNHAVKCSGLVPLCSFSPLTQSGEIPNLNTQTCPLCQDSSWPRGFCQGCDWESKAWQQFF